MAEQEQTQAPKNKGKLKLDATVADQNIAYPTDLTLLNKAREKTEGIIDILYDHVRDRMEVKPRTYRKVARKKYLAESKKKQVNKKSLRSAIRYHLNCLDRNIRSINQMLDMCVPGIPLFQKERHKRCQVPNEPGKGNQKAKSKGVHREVESEGSWRRNNCLTNSICIVGRCLWVGIHVFTKSDIYTEQTQVNAIGYY